VDDRDVIYDIYETIRSSIISTHILRI